MQKFSLFKVIFLLAAALLIGGIVFSQSTAEDDFTLVQEIGQASPGGAAYDPNFDRFVMVDLQGRLVLVDAQTRNVQHVLYPRGTYYGYQFSHDGRWLAVAEDNTVDVWRTETGELDLELQPTVALEFSADLQFSDDDTLLLFKAIVPAPDDIRISEDDTTLTPWLWDLEAERGNREGILPERRRAQPFFDLRTELLLTPNNKLIAALPRSIDVSDFSDGSYETLTNLETQRFEFDPIDVWYSLRGEHAYFRSLDQQFYYQINTETGLAHALPVGRELFPAEIDQQSQLAFGRVTQFIGKGDTRTSNSLLRLLLTEDYHPNEAPLTVMLLDILDPVTIGDDQTACLIYIFNEETGRGVIDLIRPPDVLDIALNPAQTQIAVRRGTGDRPVEIYDISTGNLMTTFAIRYPDVPQNDIFTFNRSGDALLVGWGRYDTTTGEAIIEAPRYHPGFEQFAFSTDDEEIITSNGRDLWVWDIATGAPIRRERVSLNGQLIAEALDEGRYLTSLSRFDPPAGGTTPTATPPSDLQQPSPTPETLFEETVTPDPEMLLQEIEIPAFQVPQGAGIEIYNVLTEDRNRLFYDLLPGRNVQQIIASPDWQHLLIVYASDLFSPHYPGNEIAIYSVDEGLLWFYAGDDLPAPGNRRYGWQDEHTVFVVSMSGNTDDQPERIYGLTYHSSGLPECLVEAFPDDWQQWRDLWERLNARLRADDLGRLTQRLCAADLSAPEDVDDVFFPSPTPTRPPVRPTSSRIAGLPACLSSFYGRDAANYAPQWRALTEGLDEAQVAEVEEILCEGLRQGVDLPVPNVNRASSEPRLQAVTIDVRTGERTISAFAPPPVSEPRPLAPVLDAFSEQFGFVPDEARLSNNAQLLAIRTPNNHVRVYRLNRPYATYINSIEATRSAAEAGQPVAVSLLATPTPPGIVLGGPRPTLTPTITPTAPPLPQATIGYEGEVIEVCEHNQLYDLQQPPQGYDADGRLLTIENSDVETGLITVYDPATGRTRFDESLVDTQFGVLSPGKDWLLLRNEQIVVAEADGTEPVVLYETYEQSVFPQEIFWLDDDTLQIVYQGYLPEVGRGTYTLYRQYNAGEDEYTPPVTATPFQSVNELQTNLVSIQPQVRRHVVLAVPFNAGTAQGQRYFLFDTEAGTFDYFARIADGSQLEINWAPTGDRMYYRFADAETWYVYDPAEMQHWVLGNLPTGSWSRDGRYRWSWFVFDPVETQARLAADQPVPSFQLWDHETGQTRWYCIPGLVSPGITLNNPVFWSPNGRYLAFIAALEGDVVDSMARHRTLILDTQTGSVTELSREVSRLILWTE